MITATAKETRPREGESWPEFQARRRREAAEAQLLRKHRELFRMALAGLKLDRYVIGVEHGLAEPHGPWRVHGYVVCKDCYKNAAGVIDPRTTVLDSSVREELDMSNETLTVGANMLAVIKSMLDHEKQFHGGRPR